MSVEYSFLCGYSYAWQAGYKPKAFTRLEKLLFSEKPDHNSDFAKELIVKDRVLVRQIGDSYGKLGFLFLSRDYIRKVNGKHPLAHIYVSYHLYNFIYDCKAFLDALAVMLNDSCSIGETIGVRIDLKRKPFREKIIQREAKLEKVIRKHEDWFGVVAAWRDDLIHRFSTTIAPFLSLDHRPSEQELNQTGYQPCMMLMEPRPLFGEYVKELEKKYGKGNIMREIDPFCEEWIDKACDLYDQACSAIADKLDLCSRRAR
jgi:hypothetical protein